MSVFKDFLPMVQAAIPVPVDEDDLLVAICKNPLMVKEISSGGDIGRILTSNLQPVVGVLVAQTHDSSPDPFDISGPATPTSTGDEAVLQDIANMVAYVATGYTVDKLKNYIASHPDVKAGYDQATQKGPSAVRAYLSPRVTEIAMEEFAIK